MEPMLKTQGSSLALFLPYELQIPWWSLIMAWQQMGLIRKEMLTF